jgi:hypothetical protein
MAKSPISNLKVTKPQPRQNVSDMALMIPTKDNSEVFASNINIISLSNLHCDEAQPRISSRLPYLRAFCKWTNEAVNHGSASLATTTYEYRKLKQYICFCDSKSIDPFSADGYFAYNSELWRQVRLYSPQKKFLFQYDDGQELGVKEWTCQVAFSAINIGLMHCDFNAIDLRNQCRPFVTDPQSSAISPYHTSEQKTIVDRLVSTFFVLAAELIAYKTGVLTNCLK